MKTKTSVNKETKVLGNKILKGTNLALKQLIEDRKKTNDFIIISENGDGNPVIALWLKWIPDKSTRARLMKFF